MARGRRSNLTQDITPDQAHYILGRLIEDKRVSTAEVRGYLKGVEDEIRQLQERLEQLRGATGRSAGSAARRGVAAPATRKKRTITPEQLASRQLQGQYMSLIRQFPPEKRDRFKQISLNEGREAAVRKMKAELG